MTFDALFARVCVTFIQNAYTARAEAVLFYSHFSHTDTPRSTVDRVACATVWTHTQASVAHTLHPLHTTHKAQARPERVIALSLLTKSNGRQPLAFCLDAD
mgnify:CR=1 FL=1